MDVDIFLNTTGKLVRWITCTILFPDFNWKWVTNWILILPFLDALIKKLFSNIKIQYLFLPFFYSIYKTRSGYIIWNSFSKTLNVNKNIITWMILIKNILKTEI